MKPQFISRPDWLAEFYLVDRGKKDQLALCSIAKGNTGQTPCCLRHRLDDQYARHNRIIREMARKDRVADADHFDTDGTAVRDKRINPVD